MARSMKEVHTINYYPINEGAARRAKEMNSFSDYKEGSATAEYRAMVDKAAAIAEQQKSRVDPMYHEKIDHLLDTYARKLAENMNQGFAIDARVPSVMIAGPANFPVGKKEKQNRARDSNMEEWRYIQGLLDKIRSTGMGGISADDPAAIEKLQKKLDGLERSQLIMKEVNAYYLKHGKLDGCALLSPNQIEKRYWRHSGGRWPRRKKTRCGNFLRRGPRCCGPIPTSVLPWRSTCGPTVSTQESGMGRSKRCWIRRRAV